VPQEEEPKTQAQTPCLGHPPHYQRLAVIFDVDGIEHGGGGVGVGLFVGGDFGGVLEGLGDVVKTFEENFFAGRGDFKIVEVAVGVFDGLGGEIDGEGIALFGFGVLEELIHFGFGEDGGEDAVLEAVVIENIGVAGSDDGAEAVVFDAPGSVFATGATAEIGAGEEDGGAFVAGKIQDEIGIGLFAGEVAPVVEENAAEAFAGEGFEELLGDHLVGVYVDAI
jgi:hypothetical protein